jgi:hypothetical protein
MAIIERKPRQTRFGLFARITLGSCLLLGNCVFGVGTGLDAPLLAQASEQANRAPKGWLLAGSKPANYRTGVDRATIYQGQPSAYLQSSVPNTDGFGTLMQSIDATNYAGKRLRFRASVKSQDLGDWAGLWMRVDKQKETVAFDNMQSRAIKGTQSWNGYDVVLDVPADATSISFGVLLSGSGQVWMNHVTIETVGAETEVTGTSATRTRTPVNLDFID